MTNPMVLITAKLLQKEFPDAISITTIDEKTIRIVTRHESERYEKRDLKEHFNKLGNALGLSKIERVTIRLIAPVAVVIAGYEENKTELKLIKL